MNFGQCFEIWIIAAVRSVRLSDISVISYQCLTLPRQRTEFLSGFSVSPWQAPSWFDHKRLLKYGPVVYLTCREKPQQHFSFNPNRSDFFVMFCFHISIKFLTTLARYISKLRKDLHKSQELICFPLRGKSTIPRQEPSTFFWLVTNPSTVLTWFYWVPVRNPCGRADDGTSEL